MFEAATHVSDASHELLGTPAEAARRGLVVYSATGDVDAIDEHSRRLVAALRATGVQASYVDGGLRPARRSVECPAWLLLQYMAFSYGRWGFAPSLLVEALALRRAGARVVVLVHEGWVETEDWHSALMGSWQRVQLHLLVRIANTTIATTEALARSLGPDVEHLPVGSNITPLATTRTEARARLGLGDELVVALFGSRHDSRALDHAEAAISALERAGDGRGLRVLNLGAGVAPLDLAPGIAVDTPGYLPEGELSVRLTASDLILLPFTDGASTRRTTLMAALAHGLPVLASDGARTDSVLRSHPEAITLTPADDPGAFAAAAVALAGDGARLRAAGEAGRRLYDDRFDWPIAAARVRTAVRA